MKKVILLLSIVPFLISFQCEDDSFCGNLVEFERQDLITIENQQPSYDLGDTLWLISTVNRLQTNSNSNTTIDLFQSDEKLAYYIDLKKTSLFNDFFYINLNNNSTTLEKGEFSFNNVILIKEGEEFKSKIGIKLLEPGSYTLTIYNIASYNPSRNNCNFTSYSMVTDFVDFEGNMFTFDVE
jgi:hypothetical protein